MDWWSSCSSTGRALVRPWFGALYLSPAKLPPGFRGVAQNGQLSENMLINIGYKYGRTLWSILCIHILSIWILIIHSFSLTIKIFRISILDTIGYSNTEHLDNWWFSSQSCFFWAPQPAMMSRRYRWSCLLPDKTGMGKKTHGNYKYLRESTSGRYAPISITHQNELLNLWCLAL